MTPQNATESMNDRMPHNAAEMANDRISNGEEARVEVQGSKMTGNNEGPPGLQLQGTISYTFMLQAWGTNTNSYSIRFIKASGSLGIKCKYNKFLKNCVL